MKNTRHLIRLIPLLAFAALLSACTGGALAASSWPGLTVSEDTIYLANGTSVYAINPDNGSLKWRYPAEPDNSITFFSPPTLTGDGQLLVGSYNNVLYSLDPTNGQENWSFNQASGRYIGAPLILDDNIYVPNADQSLYALNRAGNLRWSFQTEDALWAQPSSDGNQIYLSSMDHHLYAISPESGQQIWKTSLGGAAVGTPTLSEDGTLYVGTFAKQMLAIDAQSGQVLWQTDTNGWVWSGPALHEERIYFGDLDGTFYALDRSNGAVIWSKPTSVQSDGTAVPNSPIAGTPLVQDDAIYITTEAGFLVAIDHDGNDIFRRSAGGRIYTKPVSAGELILVAPLDADDLLIAYETDGAQRWEFNPEG